MANTLQFDLVSPERKLASVQATEVQIPGTDGDLTAMEGHAATITTLRPGILKAVSAQGTQAVAVTGRRLIGHPQPPGQPSRAGSPPQPAAPEHPSTGTPPARRRRRSVGR